MLARQCDGLGPVSRLPNDSHVSLPVDDAEEAEANYGMIISDEHPNDAGFESFPAGVRTSRVGRGSLHDRARNSSSWRCERLYTKRPGIASCRFDGNIREHFWLGQPSAQFTSRWRSPALQLPAVDRSVLPDRRFPRTSSTSGEHRTDFLKTEFAPFARHPMDICGSERRADSRDSTAFVLSSMPALTRPP